MWQWIAASAPIISSQKNAVKQIWQDNCWPTLQAIPVFGGFGVDHPNAHWRRTDHMNGVYSSVTPVSSYYWEYGTTVGYTYLGTFSTEGYEEDTLKVPFCAVRPAPLLARARAPHCGITAA